MNPVYFFRSSQHDKHYLGVRRKNQNNHSYSLVKHVKQQVLSLLTALEVNRTLTRSRAHTHTFLTARFPDVFK